MKNLSEQIIERGVQQTGMPIEAVSELFTFIDLQKIKGLNAQEALAKFADYINLMGAKYKEVAMRLSSDQDSLLLQNWFNDRWNDDYIHIRIPQDYRKYVNTDFPMFSPPRMELADVVNFNKQPFYERGNRGSLDRNSFGGTIRFDEDPTIPYRFFIVRENVPEHFYIEIPVTSLEQVLKEGFPDVSDNEDDREIFKHLVDAQHSSEVNLAEQVDSFGGKEGYNKRRVILSIASNDLEINADNMYTRKHTGSKKFGGTRLLGVFFSGAIPPKALKVVATQQAKGHYSRVAQPHIKTN